MNSSKCESKACTDVQAVSFPSIGRFTFENEGHEGGIYFTRYLHVPSNSSGLTIGRGYDMRDKPAASIKKDLTAIGISAERADQLSKAAGIRGLLARKFIQDHRLEEFSITPEQQKKLFDISYGEAIKTVQRICTKADVAKAYGITDFSKLHPAIQQVLVDLCYRGDYSPFNRKAIQPAVVKNDLVAFRKAVAGLSGIPPDRRQKQLKLLDEAISKLPVKAPPVFARR